MKPLPLIACRVFVGLALTAPSAPPPAQAAPPPAQADARQSIQASYDQMNAAMTRRDLAAMMSYFAPDYQGVDAKGNRLSLDQVRKSDAEVLGKVKTLQTDTTIQSLDLTPAGATVLVQQHTDISAQYRLLFIRKTAKVVSDSVSRDLWAKTPQGWRLKQSQNLSNKITLNGKPVD